MSGATFTYQGSDQTITVGCETFLRNKVTFVTDAETIELVRAHGEFAERKPPTPPAQPVVADSDA